MEADRWEVVVRSRMEAEEGLSSLEGVVEASRLVEVEELMSHC